MVKRYNLKELTNLNFIDLTNRTYYCGKYDLPYISCPNLVNPDYLVLYGEKCNYCKTERTFLCFYQFDKEFDNKNGLFEAIYYNNIKLLKYYKDRFKSIKYAISPDYSQIGDIPRTENIYRLFKARIVSLWLLLECNIIVVPNVTYASEDYFDVMLDGMEDAEVIAFSVKGCIKDADERNLLLQAIKYTVDNLVNLKKIIVYSVSINDKKVFDIFEYASSKQIEVVIPNNILKERNIMNMGVQSNGEE